MKQFVIAILILMLAATALGGSRYMDTVPQPVAHYKMDDNLVTTTVVDSKGYSNGTSTQNTSAIHTVGKIGGALSFDGDTDYVDTQNTFNLVFQDDFTISAWVRLADGWGVGADMQYICGIQQEIEGIPVVYYGVALKILADGHLLASYVSGQDDSGILSKEVIFIDDPNTQETWHHIVMISETNAGNVYLYFDGKLLEIDVSGSYAPTAIYSSTLDLYIGAYHAFSEVGLDYFLKGNIDNFMIFNKVLTQTDINRLHYQKYNSGRMKSRYCF